MDREKKIVGGIGEKLAIKFLKSRGYAILETNYRTIFGELDAIAKKDGFMIFIEIKTRASSSLGPPYLAVTALKIRHIIKNALFYLKMRGQVYCDWRIDVVSVKLTPNNKCESIELIENAVCDNY
ncbi:MAG: YraN family protein [Thermoplasmata archaeon]|nr:YraN family protein [Thermoplasmata archaeon]